MSINSSKPASSFSFSFSSRWHRSARKGPYALRPVSQQSPQGCPRNSANICLVEHRSFSAFEGGMSAASFLHSSFLQAVNAVMLWLVRAEKVPQASEHLCPAKLQTRCDICCACQSICPFIPTDSASRQPVRTLRPHRLLGLVVKESTSRAEDPGFGSRLRREDISGSSHTSDLKIGTPVATLPGDWRYRVSAGTGRPGVSILWLDEVESLICNFCLNAVARKLVWVGPSLKYTSMLLGH